jgi:hypothetical protein
MGRVSMRSPTRAQDPQYVAIIADIIRSRRIVGVDRRDLQKNIEGTLADLNRRFADALAAKFVLTIGDEFQALLKTGKPIPEIIRHIEVALPDVEIRLGIGRGPLETALRKDAIGMDGPVWHAARAAIGLAKADHLLGGVFSGFGNDDPVLNGLARVLHYVRHRLTSKQRAILEHLLKSNNQRKLANKTGVSPQAISKQARASGSDAYREAEDAFRTVLARSSPATEPPEPK